VRWIAGEEQSIYDHLNTDRNLTWILQRYLQHHGPVSSDELARRYGVPAQRVDHILEGMTPGNDFIRGHFVPARKEDADKRQWCYRPNIEKVHRQTIAILRKEITPSQVHDFARFLFRWQHVATRTQESGTSGLQHCLAQLQGLSIPAEIWEREILGRRVMNYTSSLLSQVTSSGSIVWTGAGPGRMRPVLRGEGNTFLDGQETNATVGEAAQRVLSYLTTHGASFFADIRTGTRMSLDGTNAGIAELFWKGIITNDVYLELQSLRKSLRRSPDIPIDRIEIVDPRHNPRRGRLMQQARRAMREVPGWAGRWSLVRLAGVLGDPLTMEERVHRQALQFLDRYGIVAREFCKREDLLPWPLIAMELQRMEMRGEVRKGYFVEGLSGMQYALPAAVDELQHTRGASDADVPPLLLNACDPANPYGPGLELPLRGNTAVDSESGGPGFARIPGNYVVFHRGVPVLLLAHYGKKIWTLAEADAHVIHDALRIFVDMIRLPDHLRPFNDITIEHCDTLRTRESPFEPVLRSLGFRAERNQTMRYDGY
jgi:ATP-dependent Lhr-like helicase